MFKRKNGLRALLYASYVGLSSIAIADAGSAHMWEGWGSGHMTFGIMPMALFWLFLVVFIVFLMRWITRDSVVNKPSPKKASLDILEERFARGEIDKKEFE
ncbi:MAG: putative membrane protein [Gammaproteobacteria bacterium]|jgi:putative membrane protein